MCDLHIDRECDKAIEDMLDAMQRRKEDVGHVDFLLIVPAHPGERMIIAFGPSVQPETIPRFGNNPELALATAQKSRCSTSPLSTSTDREMTALNSALCNFERQTGREYLVIYVPQCRYADIVMTRNGAPCPPDMSPEEVLALFIPARRG